MARQMGITRDVIYTRAAAEDHPQVSVARDTPEFRLPHQHIAHCIRIDRCIVPPSHIQIRRQFGEGAAPLRYRRLAARLHQDNLARRSHIATFPFHALRCSSTARRSNIGETH